MAEAVVGNVALKEANGPKLFGLLAANVTFFYLLLHAGPISVGDWQSLVRGWAALVPAGIGMSLVGILNGQISSDMKARLVFMRWHHPYPGCRAFTCHGPNSMAVDMPAIERLHGSLPTDPKQQNVFWYTKLYLPLASVAAVAQAHRHFLFARDYAFMSLLMLIGFGAAGFFFMPAKAACAYLLLLLAQWALASNAAAVGGKRLVTIVLARSAG